MTWREYAESINWGTDVPVEDVPKLAITALAALGGLVFSWIRHKRDLKESEARKIALYIDEFASRLEDSVHRIEADDQAGDICNELRHRVGYFGEIADKSVEAKVISEEQKKEMLRHLLGASNVELVAARLTGRPMADKEPLLEEMRHAASEFRALAGKIRAS
jgi:hypothetical protein